MIAEGARILVLEDEDVTRALLVAHLQREGFLVSQAWDGATMRAVLDEREVDVVLLDVELPGENGFELVKLVRGAGVIFLTRRAGLEDRVLGLELGGDDYMVKPPEIRELIARIRALLRRRSAPSISGVIRFGEWSLHPERRSLSSTTGAHSLLSPAEVALLTTLAAARGDVVTREKLLEVLSTLDVGGGSLDVLIHRLRRKLGEGGAVAPQILLTVYGKGYRIGVTPNSTT